MPRKEALSSNLSPQVQQEMAGDGIEKYELPKALVARISKSNMSPNIKLQKEVVMSLVKGSTVFINYVMATAHEVALSKQHKSIAASDVLKALEILQFKDIADIVQPELDVYRELAKTDKSRRGTSNLSAAKAAAAAAAATSASTNSAAATITTSASAPIGKTKSTTAKSTATAKATATKGKGKAKTSATPAPPAVPGSGGVDPSLLFGSGSKDDAMDVDEDHPVQGEYDSVVQVEDVIQDDDDDDVEDGPEEIEDKMAIEEEELRRDDKGLDESEAGRKEWRAGTGRELA